MANKYDAEIIEPEEKKNFEDAEFNPLDEAVNEKKYTAPNINPDASDLNKPIEEPKYSPPPLRKPQQQEQKREREPFNPEMKQMPKKETEMAASGMAKMIMQGYRWMHDLGNKGLQISEKKLNKLQAEGEINLNAMIDYDYGKQVRAGDFFKEYNEQISTALSVSQEFEDEVTPVLERVLAKRGIGLTDEQLLMYMFGKDIASKGLIFFQIKSQTNFMIQNIKEATTSQYRPQQPQQPQQQYQQQQPQPEQPIEPEYFEEPQKKSAESDSIKPDIIVMPKRRAGRPSKK